jgi:hypothetical protein
MVVLSYNVTKTTSFFRAYQSENNSGATLYIDADQAQGTSYQNLLDHWIMVMTNQVSGIYII